MRVAVAQAPGVSLDQWASTLALVARLIEQAARQRADLVVLPECVWPAYCLGSTAAYWAARRSGLPGPHTFRGHLMRMARGYGVVLCAGYVDEFGQELRNAACLIGPDGRLLDVRHKCFLWGFDRDVFTAGDAIAAVDTPFGRVGLLICADARLPEIPATLITSGARLLLQPTAWVNCGTAERPWNPQPEFLIPARAVEFGVPIASASKWGRELNTDFVGSSLICDHTGRVLAHCGTAETKVIVAEVTLPHPKKPVVTPAERQTLLSSAAPAPPAKDVAPLKVVILPPGGTDSAVRRLAGPGAVLVLSPPGSAAPEFRSAQGGTISAVDISTDAAGIDGVCVAARDAGDLYRFAPLRVLALAGVHAVVILDDRPLTAQTRLLAATRACENRLFLIYRGVEEWCVFDPGGRPAHTGRYANCPPAGHTISLPVQMAANKEVAPGTDVLAGRCPRSYDF